MHKSLPSPAQSNGSSLKVRGRLIPYEEFSSRLKNFYASLGFGQVKIRHVGSGGDPDDVAADIPRKSSGGDAVIILSCRVSYNPDWGGYRGLPQLRVRRKNGDRDGQCPAPFIAPFLPNLRAAETHLRQEFSRAITTFVAERRAGSGNMLCLAGLHIDMSEFREHGEHYFVPWKAYLDTTGANFGEKHTLGQDELFVRLARRD